LFSQLLPNFFFFFFLLLLLSGVNRHVLHEWKISWKSEEPMTRQQLIQKRTEFWDTAPAFEASFNFDLG